jgi:predicted membrane channel-forming protein YqfA (hemolysin III family)
MSSDSALALASRPTEARAAGVLAAIGAWTVVVPYLGRALGLDVNVSARVEVVDHVIPGIFVVAAALYLRRLAQRRRLAGEPAALFASGVAFLAGFWVFATHVPLLADAARSDLPWEAAIWHSIAGLPVVGLACWFVVSSIPDP